MASRLVGQVGEHVVDLLLGELAESARRSIQIADLDLVRLELAGGDS